MLVCRIRSPKEVASEGDLDAHFEKLIGCCYHRLGWRLEVTKNADGTLVLQSAPSVSPEEEFYFRFKLEEDSIFLANLKIPVSERGKGVGALCVDWLKGLARDLGFKRIVLESYPSAAGFWAKMGFVRQQEEEDF